MYAVRIMAANANFNKKNYSIMTRTVFVKPWRRSERRVSEDAMMGARAAGPEMEQLLNPAVLTTLAVLTAASALHSARRYWLIFTPTLSLRSCGFD